MSVHNVLLSREQAEYLVSLLESNDESRVPDHDQVGEDLAKELRALFGMQVQADPWV